MMIRKKRSNENGREEKRREERERERTVNTAHSVSPTSERVKEFYQYQYTISQESIKYSLSFLIFYIA